MSAANIFITCRAVHLVTDGAATTLDGTVRSIGNKVYCAPHLRAAFTLRGRERALELIGATLAGTCQSFDELVQGKWVPHTIQAYREAYEGEQFELFIAGWSEDRDMPEGYWLSTRLGEEELLKMPVNALFAPSTPAVSRVADELVMDDDDAAFCAAMVRIMETQRRTTTDKHRIIGGFCQLTTITRDDIKQRILHRWDDEIGERIEAPAYHMLGGDAAALNMIVERAGMVPASVATKMRGDMVSNDVRRAEASLTMASNMLTRNPNIFAATDGREDIEKPALAFQHFVDNLGFTAAEAAKRVVEQNSPEYKAKVTARVKNEDLNKIVRDSVKVSDLQEAFDPTYWVQDIFAQITESKPVQYRPKIAFEPETRAAMLGDYEELFREHYLSTGDIAQSKTLAQNQLKRVWGVTEVAGEMTVMRFPPDRAPANAEAFKAGVNVPEAIATDAIQAIKDETGQTADRKTLRLYPLPGGQTAQAYLKGLPPPYMLTWQDENGVVHTAFPGRAFVFDPKAAIERQSEERRQQFEARRAVRDVANDFRVDRRERSSQAQRLLRSPYPHIAEDGEARFPEK